MSFELPGHCTEEEDLTAFNPTGCSTCNGGCEGITGIGNVRHLYVLCKKLSYGITIWLISKI